MFYGIISMQDDAASKAVLQSQHIASDRIYYNTNLNVLANQLRSGDVVWVISVNRFINLSQLKAFAEFCHEKGAGLRFVSQSYLDIWNGHVAPRWLFGLWCIITAFMQKEGDKSDY